MKTDINSEKFSKRFELFIAILLGLTAVLTAYASWQGSLYDGNQAQFYTEGNAKLTDGNAQWNEASQLVAQDMDVWNQITSLQVDQMYAEYYKDADAAEAAQYKLDQIMYNNVSDEFRVAIDWANAQEDYASPFDMEGYLDSYYIEAEAVLEAGYAQIAEGNTANDWGDKQGLVTVIFAVVLFMLGIVSTFNNMRTKFVVTGVSIVALIYGVIMMAGIPFVSLPA
jgi:hypothetical protein